MQQAVNHFNNFMAGATTAWISNNLPGYTRPESSNSDFQLGQIVGDAAALTQSFEELQAGTTMALGEAPPSSCREGRFLRPPP
jgi:hypothetical protein